MCPCSVVSRMCPCPPYGKLSPLAAAWRVARHPVILFARADDDDDNFLFTHLIGRLSSVAVTSTASSLS